MVLAFGSLGHWFESCPDLIFLPCWLVVLGLMPLLQLRSYHGGRWLICVSWLSHTSTNTTFLSKATDYFPHLLLQRWEAKIRQKEKSPQPGIELTTTRSWVWHAHHWVTRAGLFLPCICSFVSLLRTLFVRTHWSLLDWSCARCNFQPSSPHGSRIISPWILKIATSFYQSAELILSFWDFAVAVVHRPLSWLVVLM